MIGMASQTFLSPSSSDHYYPSKLGVRGSKAPRGFLQKGLLRTSSAVGTKMNLGSFTANVYLNYVFKS